MIQAQPTLSRFLSKPLNVMAGILLLAATASAMVLVYRFNPSFTHIFPPCLFNKFTGLYCPGCGGTRAVHYLLHGEIAAAFAMNPLFVASLPLIPVFAVRPQLLRRADVGVAIMVTVIAFFVLRNVPLWPFNLLAPHLISG